MSSNGLSSVKRVDCRAGLNLALHKQGGCWQTKLLCWLKCQGGTVQWLVLAGQAPTLLHVWDFPVDLVPSI